MQPAVTNTNVSYTVPDGVTVTAVPKSSLPAIFIGERLIVYAILRQSSPPSKAQKGSICLSGDLLGAKVKHKMKFQIPLAVTKENMLQVSTIHHLAAKKLIKEIELDFESRYGLMNTEIIQLSCDSNVISSQTAFIAIDEERKEAVKGSLETWNILPDIEEDLSMACSFGYESDDSDPEFCSYGAKKSLGSAALESSGFLLDDEAFLNFRYEPEKSLGSARLEPGRSLPADEKKSFKVSIKAEHPDDEDHEADRLGCLPVADSFPPKRMMARKGCAPPPPPPQVSSHYGASAPRPRKATNAPLTEDQNILTKGSTATNPLTSIINLQLASGAWKMSAEMAGVMAKSTAEMKNACPVRCEGDMETIWATVIVFIYLELRQSNFRDEWVLIAGKAQTWLKKQKLPEGCSIQVLLEKATAFLS
ncbi:Hypothetical predicted protein [Paramuricea clavata]|uniref:Uncharacterized protein n=1 Tax=Paramuricea clavata TaxID=317549 RepID=A0A6S7HT43_PARCT|nr:Hypothetical predicted protein [Paramuricea clavata]